MTTTATGRLDVTLDWTVANHQMGAFIVQGACNLKQLQAGACHFLLQLSSPPKPLKGSIPNLAPGAYGYIIANSSSKQESVSTSVILSSSSCPAASSVTMKSEPARFDVRRQLMGIF